jgi:hypothetical protein
MQGHWDGGVSGLVYVSGLIHTARGEGSVLMLRGCCDGFVDHLLHIVLFEK